MLYDVNSTCMSLGLIEHDVIKILRDTSELFNSFCANESFRRAFSTRLIELSDTVFETNHVSQKIQEYVELMENPIQKHYQRFFGISNEKFYEGIEIITTFFNQRRVYVMNSIKNNFGEEYLGDIS